MPPENISICEFSEFGEGWENAAFEPEASIYQVENEKKQGPEQKSQKKKPDMSTDEDVKVEEHLDLEQEGQEVIQGEPDDGNDFNETGEEAEIEAEALEEDVGGEEAEPEEEEGEDEDETQTKGKKAKKKKKKKVKKSEDEGKDSDEVCILDQNEGAEENSG